MSSVKVRSEYRILIVQVLRVRHRGGFRGGGGEGIG